MNKTQKDLTLQSLTSEHYSPPWVVDMARYIMGSIDLDPFTSREVNDWSVKASQICDKNQDGFNYLKELIQDSDIQSERVHTFVFCNPPSEKSGDASRAFRLLYKAWECGAVKQAVFVAFSLETVDQCCELTHSLPRLMLRNRLKYWSWDDVNDVFCEGQWQIKREGKFTVTRSSENNYWRVVSRGFSQSHYATKNEAIAACDGNYKIWSNSPTKHSTIILLPPRTNSGWNECLLKAQSFKLPVEGYWSIPHFLTNLGAK